MKIRIADRLYDVGNIDRLTLLQTLTLKKELKGYPFETTFEHVKDILSGAERESPTPETDDEKEWEGLLVAAVMVWAARSLSGERISILDACDVPVVDLAYLDDDGNPIADRDEDEGKAQAQSPTGSAPGGNRATRRAAARKTSSS